MFKIKHKAKKQNKHATLLPTLKEMWDYLDQELKTLPQSKKAYACLDSSEICLPYGLPYDSTVPVGLYGAFGTIRKGNGLSLEIHLQTTDEKGNICDDMHFWTLRTSDDDMGAFENMGILSGVISGLIDEYATDLYQARVRAGMC